MLEKYLQQYRETFGENFPLFAFMGEEEEAIETIQRCLKDGKPYEPDVEDGVLF